MPDMEVFDQDIDWFLCACDRANLPMPSEAMMEAFAEKVAEIHPKTRE